MERKLHTYISKWYIPLCGLLLFALALIGTDALWAAPDASPHNQTVPPPTFTPANTPVPTATPVESDDEDDDPTPTPTPTVDDSLGNPDSSEDDDAGDTGDDGSTNAGSGNTADTSGSDTASLPTAKVKAIVLNIRSGPGPDFPVMGTAFQDDVLRVSGRSDDSWWQVCCAIGTTEPGWVDSQFVEADFEIDDLNDLVPEIAGAQLPDGQAADSGAGASVSAANDSTLEFQISHDPIFIWQGHPFTMTFAVTNTSSSTLENVQVRNDFPPELIVVGAVPADDADDVDTADDIDFSEGVNEREVMLASWSEIAGGESRSFMVMIEVSTEVEMGTVINNLAVAIADNTDDVTAGIGIGMPPTRLPNFR